MVVLVAVYLTWIDKCMHMPLPVERLQLSALQIKRAVRTGCFAFISGVKTVTDTIDDCDP